MRLTLVFSFALFLLSLTNVEAKKIAIVAGGSGEPSGTANHFQDHLEYVAAALARSGWEVHVLFANNPNSFLAPGTSSRGSFTSTNLQNAFQSILATGLDRDNQVIVALDTHGSSMSNVADHCLIAEDTRCLQASRIRDFLHAMEVRAAVERKTLRLAFIDGSCHSGTSLTFASDNICVASGTAYDSEISFDGFVRAVAVAERDKLPAHVRLTIAGNYDSYISRTSTRFTIPAISLPSSIKARAAFTNALKFVGDQVYAVGISGREPVNSETMVKTAELAQEINRLQSSELQEMSATQRAAVLDKIRQALTPIRNGEANLSQAEARVRDLDIPMEIKGYMVKPSELDHGKWDQYLEAVHVEQRRAQARGASPEEMAALARKERFYRYMAVPDNAKRVTAAAAPQIAAVRAAKQTLSPIRQAYATAMVALHLSIKSASNQYQALLRRSDSSTHICSQFEF